MIRHNGYNKKLYKDGLSRYNVLNEICNTIYYFLNIILYHNRIAWHVLFFSKFRLYNINNMRTIFETINNSLLLYQFLKNFFSVYILKWI